MAKRAHGTGTVTPYKDGFQLKWSLPDGGRGSKVIRPATKKQAEALLRGILADLDKGVFHDERKGNVRFSDFAKEYLAFKEKQVSYGQYKNYLSLLKTTILPTFGAKKLNQITRRSVDTWWSRHADHPVNRRNAYYFIKGLFEQAVEWDLLAVSPVKIKNAGADASKQRPDWTVQDFDAVLEHVPDFYHPALNVMFAGHFRIGELVALNWSDVRHGFVSSTRQKTKEGFTASTKTGQKKRIQLLERGREALASLPPGIGGTPLFPGERAYRLPRATLQRVWTQACEAAGYEDFHIHDIRHISLSLVAESGASEKVVQQRAGHASATSTRRYMHTSQRQHAEAVESVDMLIKKISRAS